MLVCVWMMMDECMYVCMYVCMNHTQIRRGEYDAHVARLREEYERAYKAKTLRQVGRMVEWQIGDSTSFGQILTNVYLSTLCMYLSNYRATKRKEDKEARAAKANREMEQIRAHVSMQVVDRQVGRQVGRQIELPRLTVRWNRSAHM